MSPIKWLSLNFSGQGMMPPAAWLTPASIVRDAGPWNEQLSLNDDGEYFCRVLLAAKSVIFCPDALAYYRSDIPGSLSQQTSRAAWESALLSQQLCCRHLLEQSLSKETQQACANLLQRLAFAIYPDYPDLVQICESEAKKLGGSPLLPEAGRGFRFLARTLGWKPSRFLQTRIQRARAQS